MMPPPPFPELRAGNLGVRIASDPDEVDAVQALRYRVFYTEMGARADAADRRGTNATAMPTTRSPITCWSSIMRSDPARKASSGPTA